MTQRISFEQWESTYKPVNNVLVDNSSYEGIMFETYGIEVEHVREMWGSSPRNVWTLIDSEIDDGTVIVSGYRYCSRIGYFLTELPCESDYVEVEA